VAAIFHPHEPGWQEFKRQYNHRSVRRAFAGPCSPLYLHCGRAPLRPLFLLHLENYVPGWR